jgi:serine-type D-Ala-D-Ala carboxypeptidase (penicillin-binding protein 5/6)
MRLAALAAFAAILLSPLSALAQSAPALDTPARHVAIMDGATGLMLYCGDCETAMPPASMSKLMTVLVVAERLKDGRLTMQTRFPVSENAWRHGAMSDGSHMFLELGSTVSVSDLLHGVITVSANDGCIVLAEGISGSEDAFVVEMNRRAQQLGLRSAHFRNATGLPDPDHVISAADLARIARIIITQYPDLYAMYSEPAFTYNGHTQQNRNPLLGAFPGADGVKTGHTDDSGYGLVGSAVLNGQRRIIVFNGLPSMAARRAESERIMRAAFHDFGVVHLAKAGDKLGEAEVWMGSRHVVPLVAEHDIVIAGMRSVQAGLSAHIAYDGPLRAPLKKGAAAARLVVEGPGFQTQEFPLAAGDRIGRANWFARAWTGLRLTLFGGG